MRTDVRIIGAGVAGLACALGVDGPSVAVANDTNPEADVASAWAQGGMAAALGKDDAPALHATDTLAAAAGIADERVVAELTAEAPAAIALLERFGSGLRRAIEACDELGRTPAGVDSRVRDALAVARAVASSALLRRESRGTRFRRDFPQPDARLSSRSFSAPRTLVAPTS